MPERCHSITVSGRRGDAEEVVVETYVHVSSLRTVITARESAAVSEESEFTITCHATAITAVRVVGASEIHECECVVIDAPEHHPHDRRHDDDDRDDDDAPHDRDHDDDKDDGDDDDDRVQDSDERRADKTVGGAGSGATGTAGTGAGGAAGGVCTGGTAPGGTGTGGTGTGATGTGGTSTGGAGTGAGGAATGGTGTGGTGAGGTGVGSSGTGGAGTGGTGASGTGAGGTGGAGGGAGATGTGISGGAQGDGRGVKWGRPDESGWQRLSVPFTLPVTAKNWPPRYQNAPSPGDPHVAQIDAAEAKRRLMGLHLDAYNPGTQPDQLKTLREYLFELVIGWPSTQLFDVALPASPDGAHAPRLGIGRVEQLLINALSPHLARVLGLGWVDTTAAPGVEYEYAIAGLWSPGTVAVRTITAGLAPTASLARGYARLGGAVISAPGGVPLDQAAIPTPVPEAQLWRHLRTSPAGQAVDPATPWEVQLAFDSALTGVSTPPEALLGAVRYSPGDAVRFDLPGPYSAVELQVAGRGTVTAVHRDRLTGLETVVQSGGFTTTPSSSPFPFPLPGLVGPMTTVTLTAPSPGAAPIDAVIVSVWGGSPVVIGDLRLHVVAGDDPGLRWAAIPPPKAIAAPSPPKHVVGIFRHREAVVERETGAVVPQSVFEVQCGAAPPQHVAGDPNDDVMNLPEPKVAVGYVAHRRDESSSPWIPLQRIIGASGSPTPQDSPLLHLEARIARFGESPLADPRHGWEWQVAAFELFGARGRFSHSSKPIGVLLQPAVPTTVTVTHFDNSVTGGGHADTGRWVGGTLKVRAAWAGASLLANPDGRSARIAAVPVALDDSEGAPIGTLDIDVPSPAPLRATLIKVDTTDKDHVTLTFDRALPPSDDGGRAPGLLVLAGVSGAPASVAERYLVAPTGNPTVTVAAAAVSRLRTNSPLFVGGPTYFIQPYVTVQDLAVALEVPADQRSARGRLRVIAAPTAPFDPTVRLTDPNTGVANPLPVSTAAGFVGQQWLQPPAPAPPVHATHHVYFGAADYHGTARRTLVELQLSTDPLVTSHTLSRAPVETVEGTDALRRRTAGGPLVGVVPPGVSSAAELTAWEAALGDWLTAYNARTGAGLTAATALSDPQARNVWAEHFFGGLLDEEVRAYANLSGNRPAFAPVPSAVYTEVDGHPCDTVDGHGDGRYLHLLTALNKAGSAVDAVECSGPSYVRPVLAPGTPAYLRAERATGGAVGHVALTWPMTDTAHIGGYLLYTAATAAELADLRYFGPDPSRPVPAASIDALLFDPSAAPPLRWSGGTRDPRIRGLVPDPRLVARDYNDSATQPSGDVTGVSAAHGASDMGEIVLPGGAHLDSVVGVYRLADWSPTAGPTAQPGFNYWRGSTAQLVDGGRRLIGLRVGLGRPAFVVVVGHAAGGVVVNGTLPTVTHPPLPPLPARIVQYVDTSAGATAAYTVVAVDIFGNRSAPSPIAVAG